MTTIGHGGRKPVGLWTTQAHCPQAPQAQQKQQKRTNDVLQTADIFTRYGQGRKATNEGFGVRKKTYGQKYGLKLRFKTTGPGPSGDA
jgi:hypothetical protein